MTTAATEAEHWPNARQHAGYSRMGIPPECPACPKPAAPERCEPVILDLPWHEVPLGDCVLHDGRWVLLEAMWPATDDAQWLGITVRHGGESGHHQVRAGHLTVVKRYVEG